MSPTILAIAAIPAAAVYFVGLLSRNRSKTLMFAIGMALFGLVTGSPAYIVSDLFFVAVAYLWTSENFTSTAAKVNSNASRAAPSAVVRAITDAGNKAKDVLVAVLMGAVAMAVLFVILAYAIIWYNSTQKMPPPAASNPPAASAAPLQSPTASLPNQGKSRVAKTDARVRERSWDKRDCLALLDNEKIARCSMTPR